MLSNTQQDVVFCSTMLQYDSKMLPCYLQFSSGCGFRDSTIFLQRLDVTWINFRPLAEFGCIIFSLQFGCRICSMLPMLEKPDCLLRPI